ncbi:hypothetical protein [Novosphingobium sp. FKTRR1]|uniref:hypothetical protein n=1 Tax=Novosphingobium sp. FKTRR1 TaxID=2879118 RepID=UPI001CF065C9|nr:hypothetical protein [Novosphingobium sp. FKTRR1]
MGVDQPRVFLRARQRSRTALRAFSRNLIPAIGEVGVDRFQMTVAGEWRVSSRQHPDTLTTEEYFDLLATASDEVSWFRLPARRTNGLRIETRSQAPTTLGPLVINVNGRNATQSWFKAELAGANPTRTLAHLLAEWGDEDDFLATISELSSYQFFAIANTPIPRAIGKDADNWLFEPALTLRCLGSDPYAVFLPIYVLQLQRLIAHLLAPHTSHRVRAEGADAVVEDQGATIRIKWGEVRVPQIECYFERHHGGAVGSVRAAAAVALAETDMTNVHRYTRPTSDWVERQDDCLSIGFTLTDKYRLGVYAKSPSRFRFEVRRLKKGDYSALDRPARPQDRLLAILEMERLNLLTAVRWSRFGEMFDERPAPQITDLTRLCGMIAQLCAAHLVGVQGVMARLFEDGGISRNGHDELPEALLDDLCKVGILHRFVIGRRDHQHPVKRYALVPQYRHLMDAVMAGLALHSASATAEAQPTDFIDNESRGR